jgi:23S rRNA (uracil747-C5)-methyltransferase
VALVNSEIQFGFYDSGIQFKKLENCPLQANPINTCLPLLKKILAEYKIIPYDLKSKIGELKYVLITYSKSTDELLLRFVLRSKESLDRLKKMAVALHLQSKNIKVVTANIQNVHQAILEGEEELVLTESDFITHHFGTSTLYQGSRSFFQTNTDMAISLYEQFQKELSTREVNSLLDLYCGVGAFSLYARKFCKKVVGIEISKEAIEYAKKNQSSGIEFHALDVEKYLNQPTEHFDAIVVNPPRRGLNDQIITQLIKISPEYIFYSSCNAETLERDWQSLKNNYQIDSLQLFDMFPYTMHFETLVVLSRKKD